MGDSKRTAVGITSAIAVVALVAMALLVAKLVSIVESGGEAGKNAKLRNGGGGWQQRLSKLQARVKKMVSLSAVKIVVVVWQIVTQVGAVFIS